MLRWVPVRACAAGSATGNISSRGRRHGIAKPFCGALEIRGGKNKVLNTLDGAKNAISKKLRPLALSIGPILSYELVSISRKELVGIRRFGDNSARYYRRVFRPRPRCIPGHLLVRASLRLEDGEKFFGQDAVSCP